MASESERPGRARPAGGTGGGRRNGSRTSDGRRSGSTPGRRSTTQDEGFPAEATATETDAQLADTAATQREAAARREAARTAPRTGGEAEAGAEGPADAQAGATDDDSRARGEQDGAKGGSDAGSSQREAPGGLAGLVQRRARKGSLDAIDPDFARMQRFVWDFVQDHYFRMETEGWHRLPDPPALIVGIHAAGIFPVEAWMFGLQWNRRFGEKRIMHGTAHDTLMATPLVGEYFRRMGVMSASPETVSEALGAGRDVIVYPGGDIDSLRPWTQRDEVKLAGRRGFVKQAIKSGVPIVPLAKTGGTDTMFTLPGGRVVARALGLKQLARIESLPLAVGLPWGVAPGVLPFLPLPAKLRIEILDPVYVDDDPARADDDEYVNTIYEEVEFRIREGVQRLSRRRSFPVLG